jgi:hypothetical protein
MPGTNETESPEPDIPAIPQPEKPPSVVLTPTKDIAIRPDISVEPKNNGSDLPDEKVVDDPVYDHGDDVKAQDLSAYDESSEPEVETSSTAELLSPESEESTSITTDDSSSIEQALVDSPVVEQKVPESSATSTQITPDPDTPPSLTSAATTGLTDEKIDQKEDPDSLEKLSLTQQNVEDVKEETPPVTVTTCSSSPPFEARAVPYISPTSSLDISDPLQEAESPEVEKSLNETHVVKRKASTMSKTDSLPSSTDATKATSSYATTTIRVQTSQSTYEVNAESSFPVTHTETTTDIPETQTTESQKVGKEDDLKENSTEQPETNPLGKNLSKPGETEGGTENVKPRTDYNDSGRQAEVNRSTSAWKVWSPPNCQCCSCCTCEESTTPSTPAPEPSGGRSEPSRWSSPCCQCHTCCTDTCCECCCTCHVSSEGDEGDDEVGCLAFLKDFVSVLPFVKVRKKSSVSLGPSIKSEDVKGEQNKVEENVTEVPAEDQSDHQVDLRADDKSPADTNSPGLNQLDVEEVDLPDIEALEITFTEAANIIESTESSLKTASQNSGTSSNCSAENIPVATPEKTPEATSEKTPEATPERNSEATPEKTPVATTENNPESTPDKKLEATSDISTKATPEKLQLQPVGPVKEAEEEENETFSLKAIWDKLVFYKHMLISPILEEADGIATPTETVVVDPTPSPVVPNDTVPTANPVQTSVNSPISDPDVFERQDSSDVFSITTTSTNKSKKKGLKQRLKRWFNFKKTAKKMRQRYKSRDSISTTSDNRG